MKIYIDESGSFVDATARDSWNCVSGLCVPGPARRVVERLIKDLRRGCIASKGDEVKLRDLSEQRYFQFLRDLSETNVSLFSVAIDSGGEDRERIEAYRENGVAQMTEQIPGMLHPDGKEGLTRLRDQFRDMSLQLYVQMYCQVELIEDILRRSILHYTNVCPRALRNFRWRIDQKGSSVTDFENAFLRTVPPLLQDRSLKEPFVTLAGPQGKAISRFYFEKGKVPRWHVSEDRVPDENSLNVQKMFREDIQFCDSKALHGIQAVDLLASGTRRLLRGDFEDNDSAARYIGRLMLNTFKGQSVLRPITFTAERQCEGQAARALRLVDRHCRPIL